MYLFNHLFIIVVFIWTVLSILAAVTPEFHSQNNSVSYPIQIDKAPVRFVNFHECIENIVQNN